MNNSEKQVILEQLQRDHSSQDIHQLYQRYHTRTHSTPTTGTVVSIRINKHKRNRIVVDKSSYPSIPTHIYSNMWTDIYQPLTCNEVLGNSEQCTLLYKWLATWTERQPKEDARCEDVKSGGGDRESGVMWEDDNNLLSLAEMRDHRGRVFQGQRKRYYSSESEDDDLCPPLSMLLCGRPGSGKTASLYACANQLGIKVSIGQCWVTVH